MSVSSHRPSWPLLLVPVGVVGAVAAVMAKRVSELDGRFSWLFLSGVAGACVAWFAFGWLERRVESLSQGTPGPTVPMEAARRGDVAAVFAPPLSNVAPQLLTGPPAPIIVPGATIRVEAFSLPKDGSADHENEDAWAVDGAAGVLVVADGASSSFAARAWSHALVEIASASKAPFGASFVSGVVAAAASRWADEHSGTKLEWWAQEGLRRGAFATLLMVRVGVANGRRGWSALAVGDSCILHLRPVRANWSLVDSFPVSSAEAFGSHPDLLSSVNPVVATPVLRSGELRSGDVLIVATDAVSEWLLGDVSRLTLAAAQPIDVVQAAVIDARRGRRMVNDDATLLRLEEALR